MKNYFYAIAFALLALTTSCKDEYANLPDGLYARIETSKGNIMLSLEYTKTPITVANFVSLAEGNNPFVSEEYKGKPFYDGQKFHRVIPNFMIQGGDPAGNGSGDAGYKFQDEITDLKHDKGGVLSMANSGPATNSSQFFITHLETPWLDGKHTVFGHVIEKGMEVVNQIQQDDAIISITIIRKGEGAKKFDAVKIFGDYFKKEAEKKKALEEKYNPIKKEKAAYFEALKATATTLPSGLIYKIIQKGNTKKVTAGTTVYIDYAGYFEDGTLFDSSIKSIEESYGKYNEQKDIQNGYKPFPFPIGKKEGLMPGFIEGLEKMNVGDKAILFIPSNLGYGAQGAGSVIPPNTNLIFEIEMHEKQTN